jgi:DNA-directed RNA polymerase specialized sigma24 family protein
MAFLAVDNASVFRVHTDAVDRFDDVELLVRIADRARDPADAAAAFKVFFARHAEFLRLACVKYRFSHSTISDEDVVLLVMGEVFHGKATFQPPAGDSETVRRHLRAWLIQIARNQFCAAMRKNHFARYLDDEPDADGVTPALYPVDEQPPPPAERTRILAFRDSLPEVDRVIFDRSIEYYDRVSQSFNVPPEVARATAAQVGRTVAAVRKRRERMMAAMREALTAT